MWVTTEKWVDIKEEIASAIFDYESEEYTRPHEEDCHHIAEDIMTKLGYYVLREPSTRRITNE